MRMPQPLKQLLPVSKSTLVQHCNGSCGDICELSLAKSTNCVSACVCVCVTYLNPGDTVTQLPDLSQMQ